MSWVESGTRDCALGLGVSLDNERIYRPLNRWGGRRRERTGEQPTQNAGCFAANPEQVEGVGQRDAFRFRASTVPMYVLSPYSIRLIPKLGLYSITQTTESFRRMQQKSNSGLDFVSFFVYLRISLATNATR